MVLCRFTCMGKEIPPAPGTSAAAYITERVEPILRESWYSIIFHSAVIVLFAVPAVFDTALLFTACVFAGCPIGICRKLPARKGGPVDIP